MFNRIEVPKLYFPCIDHGEVKPSLTSTISGVEPWVEPCGRRPNQSHLRSCFPSPPPSGAAVFCSRFHFHANANKSFQNCRVETSHVAADTRVMGRLPWWRCCVDATSTRRQHREGQGRGQTQILRTCETTDSHNKLTLYTSYTRRQVPASKRIKTSGELIMPLPQAQLHERAQAILSPRTYLCTHRALFICVWKTCIVRELHEPCIILSVRCVREFTQQGHAPPAQPCRDPCLYNLYTCEFHAAIIPCHKPYAAWPSSTYLCDTLCLAALCLAAMRRY